MIKTLTRLHSGRKYLCRVLEQTGHTSRYRSRPNTRTNMYFQRDEPKPWQPEPNQWDGGFWLQIHDSFVKQTNVRRKDIKVVFIGASIVQNWSTEGRHIWSEYYVPKGAVNYGIGGDTVQNVLWRVDNGVVDNLEPRVVVIQCGTNNIDPSGQTSEEDIARGITELVGRLRTKLPNSKVIVCGIFPICEPAMQRRAQKLNELLAKASDQINVFFIDFTQNMCDSNGRQKSNLFTDGLHLSPQGYDVWHQTMRPLFERLFNSQ